MKRGAHISILHQSKIAASVVSLSSRNSLSTLGQVQCSDSEVTKLDLSKFSIVIQDEDLLDKALNGNLIVLDLIDRGAIQPDARLYKRLFRKCTDQCKQEEGRMVHSHFMASKFQQDNFLQRIVMNMYVKFGDMEMARRVFDGMTERDMVSYTMLISEYSRSNEFNEALAMYKDMAKMGLKPNRYAYLAALKSAGGMQSYALSRGIHAACIKCGYEKNASIGYTLVDMYIRCNRMTEAMVVFDGLKRKNEFSWNAFIAAYAGEGEFDNTVKLFVKMKREGLQPTKFTYSRIFKACANIGALEQGRWVHAEIIKFGMQLIDLVGHTLLNMYGKAGSIEDAEKVFHRLVKKNIVSWNSMLTAYARNGLGQEAVDLFEEIRAVGLQQNKMTFSSVLKACCHAGLLDDGLYYFELMRKYKVEPDNKHCGSIVDLLGRAGQLDRAERFIRAMTIQPGAGVWRSLLAACRMHKNVELGAYAAERVIELEPHASAAYVLLSNIYASAGRLSDATRVRMMMQKRGVKKLEPGCSWVEIGNVVHIFMAYDTTHPQREEIRLMWKKLSDEIKKIGYVPNTSNVLWYKDQQEREKKLQYHSEKLALAFALLKTPRGTPISIKKNLRVCSDCHVAFRFVSKLIHREITLRDTTRFHHFRHGSCSCRDYW